MRQISYSDKENNFMTMNTKQNQYYSIEKGKTVQSLANLPTTSAKNDSIFSQNSNDCGKALSYGRSLNAKNNYQFKENSTGTINPFLKKESGSKEEISHHFIPKHLRNDEIFKHFVTKAIKNPETKTNKTFSKQYLCDFDIKGKKIFNF